MTEKNEFKKLALLAANAGSEKKACDIEVYELTEQSSLAFYVVVMTAESAPQMSAIEDAVSIQLKQKGSYILYKDGPASKKWKVIDYGGIIVHIFDPVSREFYALDKVYHDFKKVQWKKTPAKKIVEKIVKKVTVKKPVKKVALKKAVKKEIVKKAPAKKTVVKKPAKTAVKKTTVKKSIKKVVKKIATKKKPVKKIVKKAVVKKKAVLKKPAKKKPAKKII